MLPQLLLLARFASYMFMFMFIFMLQTPYQEFVNQ